MSFKNKYIASTLATMGGLLAASAHSEKITAWSAPQWGFVKPIDLIAVSPRAKSPVPLVFAVAQNTQLSKSLIFDQSFDKISYRPWAPIPEKIVVQNRSSQPEVVSAKQDIPRSPTHAPNFTVDTEAFVKFAASEALRNPTPSAMEQRIGQMSGQSISPASNNDSMNAAETIAQVEGATSYLSTYSTNQNALAKKLALVDQSFAQSSALQTSASMSAAPLETPPTATTPPVATTDSASVPSGVIVQQTAAPTLAKEPLRLDGIVKPIATTATAAPQKENATHQTIQPGPKPSFELALSKLVVPAADSHQAKLVIIDEEALAAGEKLGVQNAEVHWIGTQSGLMSHSQKGGGLVAPYAATQTMRFVVKAPGYLPAVGYVSQGLVNKVLLFKESRLAPVVRSLNLVPDPARVMVFGKVLDTKGNPLPNVSIDASITSPFKVFYSLGSVGLFHPRALTTGPAGDFFVSGINQGIQYFMPTQGLNAENNFTEQSSGQSLEWPAQIINLSGVGPVVTVTIQQAEQRVVKTQIVDAFALERPSGVGIQLTVGGQRGVHIPDKNGEITIPEMYRRASPDLVEVRAQGYIKSWITGSAEKGAFPERVAVFTQRQVDTLLAESLTDIQLARGVVFGNLRKEIFKNNVEIRVFDSAGKKAPDAKVLYFDDKNLARSSMTHTDPEYQNFAVANLSPGEWQVIAIDPETRKAIGAQLVRVDDNTISQLQF